MLKCTKTLTAIFMMAGLAHAEGGGALEPIDYQPTAYNPDVIRVAGPASAPLSCEAERQAAWFMNELARTDGHVEPTAQFGECARDVFARSTIGAE